MAVKLDTAAQTHCINVLNAKKSLIFVPKRLNRSFHVYHPFDACVSNRWTRKQTNPFPIDGGEHPVIGSGISRGRLFIVSTESLFIFNADTFHVVSVHELPAEISGDWLYLSVIKDIVLLSNAQIFCSFDLLSEEWSSENPDAKSLLYYHSGHRNSNLLSLDCDRKIRQYDMESKIWKILHSQYNGNIPEPIPRSALKSGNNHIFFDNNGAITIFNEQEESMRQSNVQNPCEIYPIVTAIINNTEKVEIVSSGLVHRHCDDFPVQILNLIMAWVTFDTIHMIEIREGMHDSRGTNHYVVDADYVLDK